MSNIGNKRWRQAVSPHCHISSLDSASTPEAFIEREKELESGHITCTDHGSLAGCYTVYELAKKANLTPILGIEGYYRDDNCKILQSAGIPKNDKGTFADYLKYCHFTAHFLDQDAWKTAVKLLSRAPVEKHGSEIKPLFNWDMIEELAGKNVTFGSGCLIGLSARHLMTDRADAFEIAEKYYQKYRSIVKPGNFYVEVFPHECTHNWVSGIFLKLKVGDTESEVKYWAGKTLKTNVGEIKAEALAKEFNRAGNKHEVLIGVKNKYKWQEIEPATILSVKNVEEFMRNDCTPENPTGDVQLVANKWILAMAKKYGDPILCSDDCIVQGSLIRTHRGLIPVEHVVPGDIVISHLGNFCKVEATRSLFTEKEIFELRGPAFSQKLTGDHRVWVRPSFRRNSAIVAYSQEFTDPIWISAKDVKEGSWICVPKPPRKPEVFPSRIDLSLYFTHRNISDVLIEENVIKTRSRISKKNVEYSRWIEWDEDFAFIVGLFLGDGSAYNNLVGFAIDTETWNKIGFVFEAFAKKYGFSYDQKHYETYIAFRFINSPLAKFFRRTFYDESKVKIPGLIPNLPINLRWKVVEGLLWSDGTDRNGNEGDGKVNLSMTSLPVISWAREHFLSEGVWCSFNSRKPKSSVLPIYTIDPDHNIFKYIKIWKPGSGQPKKRHVWYDDKGYWLRIKNINKIENSLPVFDLQIEGDCSFSTSCMAVHNCHFATKEDKIVQDVRLSQSGNWRFFNEYYRKSSEESWEYFKSVMQIPEKDFEGWIQNSIDWGSRFKGFKFQTKPSLPTKFYEAKYADVGAKNSLEYTMHLIKEVGRMDWNNPIWVERLKEEIKLFNKNGTIDLLPYFMLGQDVCQLYEKNEELTGPGRGSSPGVSLAYLLGITHVDPIDYNLSLNRFMTDTRIQSGKLPDIDQDLVSRDLLVGEEIEMISVILENDRVIEIPANRILETSQGPMTAEEALDKKADITEIL